MIRRFSSLLAGLLALLLVVSPHPGTGIAAPASTTAIPITDQPFFADLQATSDLWADAPLGQVEGDSPRATLLNFYAVMARVGAEQALAIREHQQHAGLLWGPSARAHIRTAEELFALAVQALDASGFPESVRGPLANEAAMQLKEVLDYVFSHSHKPLQLPDAAGLKAINAARSQPSQSWTLPDTAITLVYEPQRQSDNPGFVFSAHTVNQVGHMHAEIAGRLAASPPFATPGLHEGYSRTPGFLVPPRWYLLLPAGLRGLLEISLAGQTLFQIGAALLSVSVYLLLVRLLLRRLVHSYRQRRGDWHQDQLAWNRVLLVLPLLPLTHLTRVLLDDQINITGQPLVVITSLFFVLYFVAASFFVFILFEALGRSLSEWLVRLRGGGSELQLRRASNLVMPVGRALGGLVALAFIYRLLLALGLPPGTLLAFSAVPGLAIGLGASKLLGNLFAGLSIQTDRPVRVGEFCRIGDTLGFVSRIGLRSLEVQTLDSRVTIPNAIADELTVINHSRRTSGAAGPPMQTLEVQLAINDRFSPEQVDDLLQLVRSRLAEQADLHEPLASLDRSQPDQLSLLCLAMVSVHTWPDYLRVREDLLLRLQQWLEQVRLSTISLGVSYDTSDAQLQLLPDLIRRVVNDDPGFTLQSCRLMAIADFSYVIVFRLQGRQDSLRTFKDALHGLNRRLLQALADAGIDIPFPTQLQLQRRV
jgi:MscS family membrane protein